MKRKDFLKKAIIGTGAAVTAAVGISGCKIEEDLSESGNRSNEKFRWRLVSVWPKNFPVFGEADNLLAQWVDTMSAGRLKIQVYAKGELVPAFETFDTVSRGTADLGSSCAYYWLGKVPAAAFFAAAPFGMNAQQMASWLLAGGGLELWREVYAPFNLVPFLAGNSGVQMGGWFNKEINSVEDLKGLKMRIPGLAGKALEKAGGAALTVPGGEIYTNLERGVIDATEWVGPYHDYKMGFAKVAKYYYTPGWHEPGTQLEFIANKDAYEALPPDLKEILFTATMRVQSWMLAQFDARNGEFLEKLIAEGTELRTFPRPVLEALKKNTQEAIEELIGSDPVAKKVADHYYAFKKRIAAWTDITEKAYYNKIQEI